MVLILATGHFVWHTSTELFDLQGRLAAPCGSLAPVNRDSITAALPISLVLLAFNAFFVAAKRHRLELAATDGSRSAQAALAGARELPVKLAGAQLGFTLCDSGPGRARQARRG